MRRNFRTAVGLFGALALTAVLLPRVANAEKVADPGPFRMDVTSMYVLINDGFEFLRFPQQETQCSDGVDNDRNGLTDSADQKCAAGPDGEPAQDDDDEFTPGFQPRGGFFISGQIDQDGSLAIAKEGVRLGPMYWLVKNPFDGSVAHMRADVVGAGQSTGNLDPISGDTEIEMRLRVKLSGNLWGNQLSDSCSIGTEADPIVVRLTSGLTAPTQRFESRAGFPYQGGALSLTSSDFAVPAASGCLLGGWLDVNSFISESQFLPSARGLNLFEIGGSIAPTLQPAVAARIQTDLSGDQSHSAPLTVDFTGSGSTVTKGPASYSWIFGDGETSNEADPSHTYERPGTYSVQLVVSDADGDQSTAVEWLTVVGEDPADPGPVAKIGFRSARMPPRVAPRTLQFTADNSTVTDGPATYEWDFGDGQTATGEVADHTYTEPGTYQAVLRVADAKGRVSSANMRILVTPAFDPVARFTATSSSPEGPNPATAGNLPLTVTFDASASSGSNGPLSYSWDFGDGHHATGAKATHTYTEAGIYRPQLVVTDSRGAIGTTRSTVTAIDPYGEPQSRDTVDISITGSNKYRNYSLSGNTFGQFGIQKDNFGLVSVSGNVAVQSPVGGQARVVVDVRRLWILPTWVGQIRVSDRAAGIDVTTPVFGSVRFWESPAGTSSNVESTINWFKAGSIADPVQPYTLSWSVSHAE